MRDLFTVMKFTIKDMLSRKSFIISTIIILVLIVVGFNVPNILQSINGDLGGDKILIVDRDDIFEGQLESLNQSETIQPEIVVSDDDFETVKQKLTDGDVAAALIVEPDDTQIKLRYIVPNLATITSTPQPLIDQLTSLYTNIQISKLDLTDKQLQSLNPQFELSLEQTETTEVHGDLFVMMLLSVVLFYAIYFCAYQVSSSITTEKTSKIIETLVTSTSPRSIILGKTIGIGIVGLLQMALFVIVAIVSAYSFIDPELLNQVLDLSSITPLLGLILVIYFLLGYFTYALLYALTGSTVSKPEEIQSANSPIAILTLVGFYLAFFTLQNPTSSLNAFAAIFPISSPFCMPIRVIMGIATPFEVCLSIIVLILTILVIAYVAIKIYSDAILNYGKKQGILSLLKRSHRGHQHE